MRVLSSDNVQYANNETERNGKIFPPLPSENYVPQTMPAILGHRDMFFMCVCALFLLTNAVLGASGGSVSLVYLIIGAVIFFVPCLVAAGQLGVLYPHEGSLYNWTYHALGVYWSFFVGLVYWVTGLLAMITAGDAFVTVLQGLNNAWLPEPWQQGLVILGILALAAILCLQRMRTTQNIMNVIITAVLGAVGLITIAAVVWLFKGHPAQTSFVHPTDWAINPGNFFFFGIITLNFIGASGPLTLAGEFKGADGDAKQRRSIIINHLRWGALCVFALYFLVSLSVLVIRGQAMANAAVLPFEGFTAVDVVLGKWVGNIVVCSFLLYCVAAVVFYSTVSSRIIMLSAIDRRLPSWFGKLNSVRSPKNAIVFQMGFAALVVVLVFMIAPYVAAVGGSAANTLVVIYNVLSAGTTLVWTLATLFFFINLVLIYRRNPRHFIANRILPMPFIWLSTLVGSIACLLTIAGILTYSWIPQLVQNGQWWYYVGGLAAATIVIAALVGMGANSEAGWESMSSGQDGDV